MELNVLKKEDNSLKIELKGEGIGFANLITEELWNDNSTDEAACIKEHPYISEPKVYLKTKRKDPKIVLEDAIKRIEVQLKDLEGEFKRVLKD